METTIYFIRHGETLANSQRVLQGRIDTPLTETGKKQILKTCKDLTNMVINWKAIYTSPLGRAMETTNIITSYFPRRKPVIVEPLIMEREFGEGDGLKINDSNYRKLLYNEFEGEETEEEIIQRADTFIKKVLHDYFGKEVLVISHSHFIKACFMPYIENLRFDSKTQNGGISILKFNDFNHIRFAKMDINFIH